MSLNGSDRQPWLKWEQIEKFLGQKFPDHTREKGQTFLNSLSWVEGYVQEMLKKAMPPAEAEISSTDGAAAEVFETLEHVIIQVKLPKEEDPRALQVFVKSNQVKITGFLSGIPKLIKLPVMVVSRTAKAHYKQRVLQIQIRKRGQKENYHEVYIRY